MSSCRGPSENLVSPPRHPVEGPLPVGLAPAGVGDVRERGGNLAEPLLALLQRPSGDIGGPHRPKHDEADAHQQDGRDADRPSELPVDPDVEVPQEGLGVRIHPVRHDIELPERDPDLGRLARMREARGFPRGEARLELGDALLEAIHGVPIHARQSIQVFM